MHDSTASKQGLLHVIYEQIEKKQKHTSWFCQKGCSSCCTQSVTMTTLEGAIILAYLQEREESERFFPVLEKNADNVAAAQITTNGLVLSCLKGDEEEQVLENSWDFTPCVFLENDYCSIYPVRPFACRCFLSKRSCAQLGHAVVDAETITINTVFQQIIEHVDHGGYWGNLVHVLTFLRHQQENNKQSHSEKLLSCQPLPGFAVSPEEKERIMPMVNTLFQTPVGESTFVELMKQIR